MDQMDDGEPRESEILEADDEEENTNRTTTKYMTKYERARILGTRALQIRFELQLILNSH